MMDRRVAIGLCFALAGSFSLAKASDPPSPVKLGDIKTVYVRAVDSDSTDAAVEARKTLAESGCVKVADRAESAEAVLEITSDRDGNWIRYPLGKQRVTASAALLDRKTKNALWTDDRSSRWLATRTEAGHIVALDLIADHGCEIVDPASWEPFKNIKAGAGSNPGAAPVDTAKEPGKDASPPVGTPASPSTHAGEKVIQRGMTYSQVETVLGPPSTRANLGEKTLYKYPDLTIEFHDGKVTDVR